MGVFCDRLKLGSTAAPYCRTYQNKGRYRKKELSLLLVLLLIVMNSTLCYYWLLWRLLLNKLTCVTNQNVLMFATLQYVKWQVSKNKNTPQGMISTHCTWPWLSQSLERFLGLNHEKNQALLLVWDDFPDLRQPLLYALLLLSTLL